MSEATESGGSVPHYRAKAPMRLPAFLTVVGVSNFLVLMDAGRASTFMLAVFGVFGIVALAAWYRMLTRPILELDGSVARIAPKPLRPVEEVQLAGAGEWSYGDALLRLPTGSGEGWEGFVRLKPADEEALETALSARGLARIADEG